MSKHPRPFPHDPIRKLAENLWEVQGDMPNMPLRRRMVLAREPDGRVLVHNAMILQEDAMAEIEAWGTPTWMVVPNAYHRLDAPHFKNRYPTIKVVCPQEAIGRVGERVPVDGSYSSLPELVNTRFEVLDGTKSGEAAFVVSTAAGVALVVNDALFNVTHLPGLSGFIMKLIGSAGGLKVTNIFKWMAVSDRKALSDHLRRLSELPQLRWLIPGHGEIVEADVGPALRKAADQLHN